MYHLWSGLRSSQIYVQGNIRDEARSVIPYIKSRNCTSSEVLWHPDQRIMAVFCAWKPEKCILATLIEMSEHTYLDISMKHWTVGQWLSFMTESCCARTLQLVFIAPYYNRKYENDVIRLWIWIAKNVIEKSNLGNPPSQNVNQNNEGHFIGGKWAPAERSYPILCIRPTSQVTWPKRAVLRKNGLQSLYRARVFQYNVTLNGMRHVVIWEFLMERLSFPSLGNVMAYRTA